MLTQTIRSPRLLILEDEPSQRQTLEEIFAEEGYEVVCAATARQALQCLHESNDFSAGIIDLRLPDIGGKDLLECLEPYAENIPMVIHTAYSSYETARKALNVGAFAYVEKTGDPGELVRHVNRAVHVHLRLYAEQLEQAVAERTRTLQRTNETLVEYQNQLKTLVSELTLTEERLKRSVASELHDEISQSLAILNVKVKILEQSVTDPDLKNALAEISKILSHTLLESRTLTCRLSYPALNVLGLEKAIERWMIDEIRDKHGIETSFTSDCIQKSLDEDVRAVLFRGVREALTNAVKHAHASLITVSMKGRGGDLQVIVHDDGIGCEDPQMIYKSNGFGLLSVQEALERLGGRVSIESQRDQGCTVILTVPLNPKIPTPPAGSIES